MKLTDAMRYWCEKLADPNYMRWVRNRGVLCGGPVGPVLGSVNRPQTGMVRRMEEAGLIEWVPDPLHPQCRFVARLTDTGKSVATARRLCREWHELEKRIAEL